MAFGSYTKIAWRRAARTSYIVAKQHILWGAGLTIVFAIGWAALTSVSVPNVGLGLVGGTGMVLITWLIVFIVNLAKMPSRIFDEQGDRIKELEQEISVEQENPLIVFHGDGTVFYHRDQFNELLCRIGLFNGSWTTSLDGVSVKLAKSLTEELSDIPAELHLMGDDHDERNTFDISPRAKVYIDFIINRKLMTKEGGKSVLKPAFIFYFANVELRTKIGIFIEIGQWYEFELEIAARHVAARNYRFRAMAVDDKGAFAFEPVAENGVKRAEELGPET